MLDKKTILSICEALREKTVGVIGDFCVDIYWAADMTLSELSRETPHFPLPVTEERVSLGAGGNVAANAAALMPAGVLALTVFGEDWRGALLRAQAEKSGVDLRFAIQSGARVTNAYCKPLRKGVSDVVYEDPRLDFENRTPLPTSLETAVLERLPGFIESCGVICAADQFLYGTLTNRIREALIEGCKKAAKPLIADSRSRIGAYHDCILKPNETEALAAVPGGAEGTGETDPRAAARTLAKSRRAAVLCTLGAAGAYYTDGGRSFSVPAVRIEGPVDICGAGDTSLAAFACALAAGADAETAARFAALASAVTVQKLGQTGTATEEELLRVTE